MLKKVKISTCRCDLDLSLVAASPDLMNELGFDEDVESDEDLKDSSSDWDSDVEDVESLEKFEGLIKFDLSVCERI